MNPLDSTISLEAIGFHWSILFDVPNDHPIYLFQSRGGVDAWPEGYDLAQRKWWKSGEICTVTVKYEMEHHEHHEAQRPTAIIRLGLQFLGSDLQVEEQTVN